MAKKILLADDSITIQKVVELTFSDGDYEVTAVNNGAKAIASLQDSRPDIILSDIIMPEKNGYEVCEFVKSHPDYRTIPVVLLTGTFEPFDPDRAERAGCDAVVTKPFESQSLIHKVDELIQSAAPAAAPAAAAPAPNPFDETKSDRRAEPAAPPAFESETAPFEEAPGPSPEEIFGVSSSAEPAAQPSEAGFGFGETGGAPFGEVPRSEPEPPAEEPKSETDASWSAATTAFPKMSFDDLQKMRGESAEPPPPASGALPWETASAPEPEQPAWPSGGGEAAEESPFESEPPAPAEAPPVAFEPPPMPEPEPEPAYSAETKAFPKMSFTDLQKMAEEKPAEPEWARPQAAPEPEPEPERQPEPQAAASEPERYDAVAEPSFGDASATLSDEQIDRIARRVVELIGEKVVRDIAWEVIPDLAQSVVRERIRQLESED